MLSSESTRPIRIWRPAELRGATLLHGDLSRHTFPRHSHDEVVVGFNVRGAHTFWCRGGVHEVHPFTLALVNAGDVHTGSVLGSEGWDYRAFYLTRELLDAAGFDAELSAPGNQIEFPRCTVNDPVLTRELLAVHKLLDAPDADPLERETRGLEAIASLISRHAARRSPPRALPFRNTLGRVRDFIHAEYRRTIRLAELQEISGYGKYKLITSFRAVYGQPPYELVVALRVADARRRLARGESLASVALAVGFTDQSHLNRQFKRLVGVTPGQYSRAVQPHPSSDTRRRARASAAMRSPTSSTDDRKLDTQQRNAAP
jgi:AraC-like DNA-binding protein